MSAFSNFAENAILNLIVNGTAFSPTGHVALFTSDPAEDGTGTEVSGGSYARIATAAVFPAASGAGGSVANDADITFPTATGNWGTVTHVGIMDALTAGNLLMYGALSASKVVNNGDTFKFATGNLTLTVA